MQLFLALGLGMGLPYLLLATAAGSIKSLPRSGDWLVWVERLFGFLLLGLAAHFVAPLAPRGIGRMLLPAVLASAGLYLGFVDRSGRNLAWFRSLKPAVGIGALILATWIAWPSKAEKRIRWTPFSEPALAAARAAGLPVLVDFVADWCIPCHEMEASTFTDPHVQESLARFATLRADLTAEIPEISTLVAQYDIKGVPTLLLLDSRGEEADRLVGFVGVAELLGALERVERARTPA